MRGTAAAWTRRAGAAALAALLAGPVAAQDNPAELPSCADLAAGEAPADCALALDEGFLAFDYDAAGAVTVTWTDSQGVRRGEPVLLDAAGATAPPVLMDLSGDGMPEALVPVASGMVNVTYTVLAANAQGLYLPAGEISAMGAEAIEVAPDGTITSRARDGAAGQVETVFLWGMEGLEQVYQLQIDLAGQSCTLAEGARPEVIGQSAGDVVAECEEREWP